MIAFNQRLFYKSRVPIRILKPWKNLSIPKKLYFVVGLMASLIIIELLTLNFSMGNLSAVRAFVGGEGLWTKGQKQAVYQLQRYALTRDEKDYQGFKYALKVNDGDHEARLEVFKPRPDMNIVRRGFIAGQIHPDDIDPMVHLLQRFHRISFIKEAVSAWTEGDLLIDQLKISAESYHELISAGNHDHSSFKKISDRILELNNRLSVVTARFSLVLGEGSRWLERLVFVTLFSLVLTVECVGLTLTFFTSKEISSGLSSLIDVSKKIGDGQFDQRLKIKSNDEIGQLTLAVNNMGALLQKSYTGLEEKIRKRTQEITEIALENAALYDKATDAVKMRDQFLSIASHELRTPITALLLHIQMLDRLVKKSGDKLDKEKILDFTEKGIMMSRRLAIPIAI